MSIAVSTVVKPSTSLLLMTLAMCLGCFAVGVLIVLPDMIDLLHLPNMLRLLLAGSCFAAALLGAVRIFRKRTIQYLDISGIGQIRFREEPAHPGPASISGAAIGSSHATFQLLPTSTLWSHLLILNLRSDDGTTRTLVVLPDTMSGTSFRALAVACHWIAAHNNRADCEKT